MELHDLDRLSPLTPDSLPFWAAVQEHRFTIQRCTRCHRSVLYPRPACPYCHGVELAWEDSQGQGEVWSYTVVHQARSPKWQALAPYVVAIIELEPGARLLSRLIDCTPSDVHVGMPVEVGYVEDDGLVLPVFRPRG